MIDLKQFVANNGVLVSGYINGDKNFNVYNGYTEPTTGQKSEMVSQYTKAFNSKVSIEFVTYSDVASIQLEIDRQVALKKEIDTKANETVKIEENLSTNTKK